MNLLDNAGNPGRLSLDPHQERTREAHTMVISFSRDSCSKECKWFSGTPEKCPLGCPDVALARRRAKELAETDLSVLGEEKTLLLSKIAALRVQQVLRHDERLETDIIVLEHRRKQIDAEIAQREELSPTPEPSFEDLAPVVKQEAETLYEAIKKDLHYKGLNITDASVTQDDIHASLVEMLPTLNLQVLNGLDVPVSLCALSTGHQLENFVGKMVKLFAKSKNHDISLDKVKRLFEDKNIIHPLK